jgi:hypothetical protein
MPMPMANLGLEEPMSWHNFERYCAKTGAFQATPTPAVLSRAVLGSFLWYRPGLCHRFRT